MGHRLPAPQYLQPARTISTAPTAPASARGGIMAPRLLDAAGASCSVAGAAAAEHIPGHASIQRGRIWRTVIHASTPLPQCARLAGRKQPMQEAVPAFDEAAFEQAFLQAEQEAQQDVLDVTAEQSGAQTAQANPEVLAYDRPGEMDPLLMRIRETRPGV
jgi:hypothetical protein